MGVVGKDISEAKSAVALARLLVSNGCRYEVSLCFEMQRGT